jgi:hypothetical protein
MSELRSTLISNFITLHVENCCPRIHREYDYRAMREAELRIVAYSRGKADERTVSPTAAILGPSDRH